MKSAALLRNSFLDWVSTPYGAFLPDLLKSLNPSLESLLFLIMFSCRVDALCIFLSDVNVVVCVAGSSLNSGTGWVKDTVEGAAKGAGHPSPAPLAKGTDGGSEEETEAEETLAGVNGATEALTSALSSRDSCPMAWRARFTLLSSSSWLRKAERSGNWGSLWPTESSVLPLREP